VAWSLDHERFVILVKHIKMDIDPQTTTGNNLVKFEEKNKISLEYMYTQKSFDILLMYTRNCNSYCIIFQLFVIGF
jgi:hypothetical protein